MDIEKSEYRYTDYEKVDLTGLGLIYVDTSVHSLHTAFVYRLNGGMSKTLVDLVVYDWTGVKLGAAFGGGAVNHKVGLGPLSLDGIGGEGVFGDVTIGYAHDFSTDWVAGIVLGARYGNVSSDIEAPDFTIASLEADYGFDALLRVGRKLGDNTLVYAIGGYNYQHFNVDFLGGSIYDWGANGGTVGTGIEAVFNDRLTGHAEYRYSIL